MSAPPTPPPFRERLWPSPLTWLLVPGTALVGLIALLPLWWPGAVALGAAGALASATALWRAATVIEVTASQLRVGRARIDLNYLGKVTALTAEQRDAALGPKLDARAHVTVRAWVKPAVRIELIDPLDPVPYWIVSTRQPQALAAALGNAPAHSNGPGTNGPGSA